MGPQKILQFREQISEYMQTIEISDKLYKEILAHRQGKESISRVIERNFRPEKSRALQELEEIRKGKFYTRTQVEEALRD